MYRLSLFGPFHLADASGAELPLASRKARALLAYLAQTPGKPRSREEILALLWSDREEPQGRASLRQVLAGLRREVGEDVLIIDRDSVALNATSVMVAPNGDGEFLEGLHITDPAFEDWVRDERLRSAPSTSVVPQQALSDTTKPVIAVRPFDNLSNDPDQTFFSDGITEDIVMELSRFEDLTIISPRATLDLLDHDPSEDMLGTSLKVDYLVDGSVRQAGNRVRIAARLTQVENSTQIWAERYDRDLEDVFEIQDDVARQIATMVPGKIVINSYDMLSRDHRADLSAYQHVLRGEWSNWHDFGGAAARESFEKAIAADPSSSRANANLAQWHANQLLLSADSFELTADLVRMYANRALETDQTNALNLCYLSGAYLILGEHDLVRNFTDKMIALNPNHYMVMIYAAENFGWMGDLEASMHWLAKYWQVVPKSYGADVGSSCELYYMAERYEDAIDVMTSFPNINHAHAIVLAACHAQLGNTEATEAYRLRAEALKPTGFDFSEYETAILRLCARERERALWREGHRKAGFL
ncbi:MAG: winged helix-turn-helix domain-containing protein [Pseudomonadota bacterium]